MSHRTRRHLWRPLLIASLAALVAHAGAEAQTSAGAQESGARITFADGRVSFVAPPGFSALTTDELAAKYPQSGAPRLAVGNARRTTSIAYDLLDQRAPSEDLDAARKFLADTYEKALPNVKWVGNEVRKVGSRTWAYLEFTANATDQELHNIVLVSTYDGRILMFNFNSTSAEFPRVEQALRASMATIAIAAPKAP